MPGSVASRKNSEQPGPTTTQIVSAVDRAPWRLVSFVRSRGGLSGRAEIAQDGDPEQSPLGFLRDEQLVDELLRERRPGRKPDFLEGGVRDVRCTIHEKPHNTLEFVGPHVAEKVPRDADGVAIEERRADLRVLPGTRIGGKGGQNLVGLPIGLGDLREPDVGAPMELPKDGAPQVEPSRMATDGHMCLYDLVRRELVVGEKGTQGARVLAELVPKGVRAPGVRENAGGVLRIRGWWPGPISTRLYATSCTP